MRYITICLAAMAVGFGVNGSANAQYGIGRVPSESTFPALGRVASPVRNVESGRKLNNEGLRQLLVQLGYEPETLKFGQNYTAFKIKLKHVDGVRTHMIAIDTNAQTVTIVGGGHHGRPDPAKANNVWFQKLLAINNRVAPNCIFMNDSKVFGVTTSTGNSDITSDVLRNRIALHVSIFDKDFMPLMNELVEMGRSSPSYTPVSQTRY